MTRLETVRVAAGNTPRHTVNKPAILPGPRQAGTLVRKIMLPRHIDHITCAEAHSAFIDPIRDDMPRVSVTVARANDVFPHTRLRNAIITDTSGTGWARQDKHNINNPWSKKKTGLHQLASLAERRSDGFQMTVVAVHFPAARDASQSVWDRMAGEVAFYISRIDGPVALSGDFNRGVRMVGAAFSDLQVAASDEVMHVLVRGFKPLPADVVYPLYHPGVSDHPGLPIATLIPIDTRRLARLPR